MLGKRPLKVDYDHALHGETHSVQGACEALRALMTSMPRAVLDVGCGTGTWLRAALDLGAREIVGVDGADLPAEALCVSKEHVRQADLSRPLNLARRFELVLCLEVAEHLEPASAATLIDTLAAHGDRILFSAAAPGQRGTHHVNCQWPDYWQSLFNARGFTCDDAVRWEIWRNGRIEPWYRQNIMMAVRDEARAGSEPRILPVLHPEMVEQVAPQFLDENVAAIERGVLPWLWYVSAPFKAGGSKIRRRLRQK